MFIILFFVFTPINTDAKSGCCSGHGGVNCSVGPQSNGHVICNDGWTGSSCLYSEMVMCGGSSTSSTTNINTVQVNPPTSTPIPPTKTPIQIPTPILQVTGDSDSNPSQSSSNGFVGGLFTAGLIYGAYRLNKKHQITTSKS